MLFLGTVHFPATSAMDFAQKAVEELTTNPYPEYTKRNYYFKFAEDGMVMYVIYDIGKGKEEEALKDINERLFKFSASIEGFNPKLEPVLSFEEVFSLINMTAPPK